LHSQRVFPMAKRAERTVAKRAPAFRKKRKPITKPSQGFSMGKRDLSHARLRVTAGWDPEAGVWYVAGSNLPGLHLEGATPLEFTISCLERLGICWRVAASRKFRSTSSRQSKSCRGAYGSLREGLRQGR
jgi:hypothetical protein